MKRGTIAAIKKQFGHPATFTLDPVAASRSCSAKYLRPSPKAIVETRRCCAPEDALESALAMHIAAKEPLPAPSKAEAGEEMVPLSAPGIAKTALYDAMREQGFGRAACRARLVPCRRRGTTRIVIVAPSNVEACENEERRDEKAGCRAGLDPPFDHGGSRSALRLLLGSALRFVSKLVHLSSD